MKNYFFIYEIKEGEGYHLKIKYDDLLFIQAKGDYVSIQTRNRRYMVHKTLKQITEELSNILYRNHRSYSVNINNIDIVSKQDIHIEEYEIPLGEEYKKELLNILYKN